MLALIEDFFRQCLQDMIILRHVGGNLWVPVIKIRFHLHKPEFWRRNPESRKTDRNRAYFLIWSEWRLTVIAATVRIALVDILDLSEVDIPAGVFLHPAVGWG